MFVAQPRAIMHADLDAFYASVEQRDDPALRGRGGRRARELCPEAIVVPPRWSAYVAASNAVRDVLERHAPVVERTSIDEAYLDVGGLERVTGTPAAIGRRLRREVREEVGLPITVGVGSTRVLAKVAGAAAKPDGLCVVEPGRELAVLHPLPVGRLPGVGPRTLPRLDALGVRTIGDLAACPERELAAMLGPSAARHLRALAHNRDPAPVRPGRRRRSLGAQAALGRPTADPARIDEALLGLADKVGRRLRASGLGGRTVTLRLRDGDYARTSRSRTLPRPTCATDVVLATVRELLAAERAAMQRRRLTLVGIALTNLEPVAGRQLELPLEDTPDRAALDAAVDGVRARFGAAAVTRGVLVGRGAETAAWLGPEDVRKAS